MPQPEEKERKYTRNRVRKRADGSVRYVPGTYDWRTNHALDEPPLSGRWGPVTKSSRFIDRQLLYLSYKASNKLVVAECLVFKSAVLSSVFENQITENAHSPYVREFKTIRAPREVGRIREFPQNNNMVATLSDNHVLIWDIEARAKKSAVHEDADSIPDLELSGLEVEAKLAALAVNRDYFILSGGNDKNVSLWHVLDHITFTEGVWGISSGAHLPRCTYNSGHTGTVKDVQFSPSSSQEFCSVGDDSCLVLWDARDTTWTEKVENAHDGAIIHSVDWNRINENKILTGSDQFVKLYDRRSLKKPVKIIGGKPAGRCVQWCPDKESMAGSSSEDGILNVWSLEMDSESESCTRHLFKRYAGHRDGEIVDFHWNESDPWTIASLSDDSGTRGGGCGKLQIWRLNDKQYKSFVEQPSKLTP